MAKRTGLAFVLIICLLALAAASAARAQEPAATPAPDAAAAGAAPAPVIVAGGMTEEELNATFRGSFFLSPLEIALIQQALKGRVAGAQTVNLTTTQAVPPPGPRLIRVSGVVYRAPQDWIVWMNGEKVTPGKLLPEIVDIEVRDSSDVKLDWYDAVLNKVIEITLRPHQTYDVATGILLPGAAQ